MDTDQLSLICGSEERVKRWTQGMKTVFDENLAGTYILQVNGTGYACNKAVMHAALPSIPEQQWVERFSAVSADVIPKLLEYLHTCELHVSLQSLKPVLKACQILELNHLAEACKEFLLPRLCPQNYIGWLVFSIAEKLSSIKQCIKEGILIHLNEIRKHKEFQELNLAQVIELIREQARIGQNNDNLFKAVLSWIEKHNVNNAEYLFSNIDFSKCSKTSLKQISEPPYDKLEWPTALRNRFFDACLNAKDVDVSQTDEASDHKAPSPEEEHCIDWKYPSVMEFAQQVIETFKDFQIGTQHTDLTLRFSDQDIQVHSAILSASCPYFEKMFRFEQKSEANLSHMDSSVSAIVDYLYLWDIVIPDESLLEYIEVCDYFGMNAELKQCKQHAENGVRIFPKNCFQWLIGHRLFNLPQTKSRVVEFICNNFIHVCNLDGLLELNSDELIELLCEENLCSVSEKTMYDVLIAWINHDIDSRRIHLSELLKTSAMRNSTVCPDFEMDFLCTDESQFTISERTQILQTHFDHMIKALREHNHSVITDQMEKLQAEEKMNKALRHEIQNLQAELEETKEESEKLKTRLESEGKSKNDYVVAYTNLKTQLGEAQTQINNLKQNQAKLIQENNRLQDRGLCSMLVSCICCCFYCE